MASGLILELSAKGGNQPPGPTRPQPKKQPAIATIRATVRLCLRKYGFLWHRVIGMFRPSHHLDGTSASFEIWGAASTGREAVNCIDRFRLSSSSFIYSFSLSLSFVKLPSTLLFVCFFFNPFSHDSSYCQEKPQG